MQHPPEFRSFNELPALQTFCRVTHFKPGEILREKGRHYRDMYLVLEGEANVDLGLRSGSGQFLINELGAPIGEVGFLRGCAATAHVVARVPTTVLIIDYPTLARIEREQPAVVAQLLRYLALVAEERVSFNLTYVASAKAHSRTSDIDVLMCRTDEMMHAAQRLRYQVYCEELGRDSPSADHGQRTISDDLDRFGYTFIAIENGAAVGTIRGNISREGPLGVLEELYAMKMSPHHPDCTSVCTKFVVTRPKRGGPAAIKLIAALTRFGLGLGLKECYIDCVPSLLPYYKAMGFSVVGPKFFHRENGLSFPMKVDLLRYGKRLCEDNGARNQIKLYVRAQAIRLIDGLRARSGGSGQ